MPTLTFTGERIVPGKTEEPLFREHEARYVFAGEFVEGKVVLDVACGAGIGTHYLLKAGAQSCLGLDTDGPSIDYARAAYEGCQFAQCDATSLCFSDSSIDVVVSFETIEHLRDQLKFLSECNRVLKPDGVFICSTPNRTMFRWAGKNPYHVHEFTVAEFTDVLESVFGDVRLYSQENKMVLLRLCETMVWRVVDAFRSRNTIRRMFRREPVPLALGTEFDGNAGRSFKAIRPYAAGWVVRPVYILAVARKRL